MPLLHIKPLSTSITVSAGFVNSLLGTPVKFQLIPP